ncbi:MAG: apolipoprotein N-acyltransferase, partial [Candidatus Omnitrophica bacterium]|nr:apolipoprotein N-acyltransferase [Candidatus Omnitrophota bacterium]
HILVWPEGAIYQKVMFIDEYRSKITDYARRYNAFIIVGAPGNDENGYATNSAYVVSNSGEIVGRYDKVKIVPFLEGYNRGRGFFPVKTRLGSLGMAICFESAYPQVMRRLVKNGSDILFVLTNDCGFGDSPLALMHAKDTVVRAVENRRYVVRADQSGVSLIADPFGRVIKRYGRSPHEIITGTVNARYGGTPYTKFGDILPLAAFFICALIIIRKE